MPESGGTAKPTTKKSKLGGKKTSTHPTQSKVVEKLQAVSGQASTTRSGSKSPVPPNGKSIANSMRSSKSPQPTSPVPPPIVSAPLADPVKLADVAPLLTEKVPESTPVSEAVVASKEVIAQPVNPAPIATPKQQGTTDTKVTKVDDIFPDMVWEDDEITDLLATGGASVAPVTAPAPVPMLAPVLPSPVPLILETTAPTTKPTDFDAAVNAARSKKDKSPRRNNNNKAKSPAPKSPRRSDAPPAAKPSELITESTLSPNSCPMAAPELPSKAVVAEKCTPDVKPASGATETTTTLEKTEAFAVNEWQPVHDPQVKSRRKKNKSRSEDDPAAANAAPVTQPANTIVSEIKQVREQISQALQAPIKRENSADTALEAENKSLMKSVDELISRVTKLETRVGKLEKQPVGKACGRKCKPLPADSDDDMGLFASDEDESVKGVTANKSKKPGAIAKSSVVLDVKPWDDETDMNALDHAVRSIHMDGLVWGASELVPVAFNIQKLTIVCVVEDDKVSIDELVEKIEKFENIVQSVDVACFNKI